MLWRFRFLRKVVKVTIQNDHLLASREDYQTLNDFISSRARVGRRTNDLPIVAAGGVAVQLQLSDEHAELALWCWR